MLAIYTLAGFEINTSLTCLMAHEIMENSAIQEKPSQEIQETENSLEGRSLSYQVKQYTQYMDMVTS